MARGASIGASFGLSVAVARALQPTTAGTFFVLLALLTGGASLGRFGTDILGLRLVAAQPGVGRSVTGRLLGICLGGSVGAAVVLAVGLHLAWPASRPRLVATTLVAVAVAVVPVSLSVLAGALLRANRRVALGTLAELGSTPGLSAIGILAYSLVAVPSLAVVVALYLSAAVVTAAWSVPTAVRLLAPPGDAPPPPIRVSRLVPMTGTALSFYLLTWAPVLVLGALSTPTEVAYFAVAARAAAFVSLWPAIQASFLAPAFAALYHRDDIAALNRLAQRTTRLAAVIGGIFALGLTLLPLPSLLVFGPGYEGAARSTQVLALGALVVVALGPVNSLLLTCDLEHPASVLSTATLLVIIGLLAVAAPASGAAGAALALAGGTIGYAVVSAVALWRRRGIWAPLRGRITRPLGPSAPR